jgi:hypothetical protein
MHGFEWEWTASTSKRGKDEGKGVLHGGMGGPSYATERCSAVRQSDISEKGKDVGFRCCGGTANTNQVVIPSEVSAPPALAELASIDEALLGRLRHALADSTYKDLAAVAGKFTSAWRWHPAPKEDFVIARYEFQPEGSSPLYQPVLVHLCEKSEQLLGRPLDFPVEELSAPMVQSSAPNLASVQVVAWGRSGQARLSYLFGEVVVDGPPWLSIRNRPTSSQAASTASSAKPSK